MLRTQMAIKQSTKKIPWRKRYSRRKRPAPSRRKRPACALAVFQRPLKLYLSPFY